MPVRAMIPFTPAPILFSIGPLAIRYYSLAYIIGFIFAYIVLRKKYGERGEDLIVWVMLATIVGGRIGEFIFYSPSTFWTDPLEVLKIWHGGMSFHGAIIAIGFAVWLFAKRKKMAFLPLADTIVIPAAGALVLGRLANFMNGELYGTVTNVPWCVQIAGVPGCRHPSPIYEALYTLVIFIVLLLLVKSKKAVTKEPGFIFFVFVTLYGLFRFIANFWRDDIRWLGISMGQYLSLAMVIVGVWVLATKYKYRRAPKKHHVS